MWCPLNGGAGHAGFLGGALGRTHTGARDTPRTCHVTVAQRGVPLSSRSFPSQITMLCVDCNVRDVPQPRRDLVGQRNRSVLAPGASNCNCCVAFILAQVTRENCVQDSEVGI